MNRQPGAISASMMCADLAHLREDLDVLAQEKVEYLHIDVMDGEFVPNLGLGVDYIRRLRDMTDIPLDIHLMVERPEDKLDWFGIRPADRVCIHYESTRHVQRTLDRAKRYGCKVMLAINPATPVCSVEEVLDTVDGISVLTVNPGFAGQKIVASCIKKTEKLSRFLEEAGADGLDIEVDGNVSCAYAAQLRRMGANIFVAGSSSIFTPDGRVRREQTAALRAAISG